MHTANNFSIFDQDMLHAAEIDSSSNFLFRNSSEFSQFVELTSIREGKSCTSIILAYCEDKDLDPEEISKLISKPLREKLMIEMQEDGLLPRSTATLEFE
jgi:hypothetical protein